MSENLRKKMHALLLIFTVLFLLTSCATRTPAPSSLPAGQRPYKVFGKRYYPIPDATGFRQKGLASWYGPNFHGKMTANGETYNMYAMTAAHKTLPFGTRVRVKNTENGKVVEVRINDRGPFVRGRIIDLSNVAAKAIGLDIKGIGPVEIKAISSGGKKSAHTIRKNFFVQVGSFTEKANANRLAEKLRQEGHKVDLLSYKKGGDIFFRVRVKGYSRLQDAEKAVKRFRQKGYTGAIIVGK